MSEVENITQRLKLVSCLKEFVGNHVLTKNVVLKSPTILKEHLYTLEELVIVLNINNKYFEQFQCYLGLYKDIEKMKTNEYFSLLKIIECDELINEIAPLTNFAR